MEQSLLETEIRETGIYWMARDSMNLSTIRHTEITMKILSEPINRSLYIVTPPRSLHYLDYKFVTEWRVKSVLAQAQSSAKEFGRMLARNLAIHLRLLIPSSRVVEMWT